MKCLRRHRWVREEQYVLFDGPAKVMSQTPNYSAATCEPHINSVDFRPLVWWNGALNMLHKWRKASATLKPHLTYKFFCRISHFASHQLFYGETFSWFRDTKMKNFNVTLLRFNDLMSSRTKVTTLLCWPLLCSVSAPTAREKNCFECFPRASEQLFFLSCLERFPLAPRQS